MFAHHVSDSARKRYRRHADLLSSFGPLVTVLKLVKDSAVWAARSDHVAKNQRLIADKKRPRTGATKRPSLRQLSSSRMSASFTMVTQSLLPPLQDPVRDCWQREGTRDRYAYPRPGARPRARVPTPNSVVHPGQLNPDKRSDTSQ